MEYSPFLCLENNVLSCPLTPIVCLWGPMLIYELARMLWRCNGGCDVSKEGTIFSVYVILDTKFDYPVNIINYHMCQINHSL